MTTNEINRSTAIELRALAEAMRDRCEKLSEDAPGDEISLPAQTLYIAGVYASEAACKLDECQSYINQAICEIAEVSGRKNG
jgi:hypothetical protein